jgi:lipopolysaccharide/colanic/teichoic acid biosynthesis glycosyltransferase
MSIETSVGESARDRARGKSMSAHPGSAEVAASWERSLSRRLKRWLDLAVSAAILVVLWPVLALIALIIRLDSRGPAIFKQPRVGKDGRIFEMWKFRTMVADASDARHRSVVVPLVRAVITSDPTAPFRIPPAPPPDSRITRPGRWLRRTSLDELPQLVNVLRGDLSLVGPRPAVVYEFAEFDDRLRQRLSVPQGMTGLWQVSGHNIFDFRRMYELDLEYVQTWSLWLDLKILAKTPVALVVRLDSRE